MSRILKKKRNVQNHIQTFNENEMHTFTWITHCKNIRTVYEGNENMFDCVLFNKMEKKREKKIKPNSVKLFRVCFSRGPPTREQEHDRYSRSV